MYYSRELLHFVCQKKDADSSVNSLRRELLSQLASVVTDHDQLPDDSVVHGCAFLRLYAALKCIAMVK